MVTRGTDVFWRMGYSFGTYNGIYYEPDFDAYQYGPLYDRYKTFLTYLNRLYSEDLLGSRFLHLQQGHLDGAPDQRQELLLL